MIVNLSHPIPHHIGKGAPSQFEKARMVASVDPHNHKSTLMERFADSTHGRWAVRARVE